MESYGTVYFENRNSDPALESFVRNIAESDYDLGVEELSNSNGFTTVSVIGGSLTKDGVTSIIKQLDAKFVGLVKGYLIGEEDPWCTLLSIQKGQIISHTYDSGIYDYLAECEEDDIELSGELREAQLNGPKKYFETKFASWKVGLEGQNLNEISSEIESIIECSEYVF